MFLLLNHLFRERSLSFRTWSIYLINIFLSTPSVGAEFLVDLNGSMFLHTPNVGATCMCGCTWSWSWEHDKSLNKGPCRWNMVGSLLRGMPMVVDESVEVRVIGTGWWHKRRDNDLDRFRLSDRRNTLRPVPLVYCIVYEMNSREIPTHLI